MGLVVLQTSDQSSLQRGSFYDSQSKHLHVRNARTDHGTPGTNTRRDIPSLVSIKSDASVSRPHPCHLPRLHSTPALRACTPVSASTPHSRSARTQEAKPEANAPSRAPGSCSGSLHLRPPPPLSNMYMRRSTVGAGRPAVQSVAELTPSSRRVFERGALVGFLLLLHGGRCGARACLLRIDDLRRLARLFCEPPVPTRRRRHVHIVPRGQVVVPRYAERGGGVRHRVEAELVLGGKLHQGEGQAKVREGVGR